VGFAAAGGGVAAEVPPAIFSADGFSPSGGAAGDLGSSAIAQRLIHLQTNQNAAYF
jgi:hypothetical protein